MNASDVHTAMALLQELWPDAGWPVSVQVAFAQKMGTLKISADDARAVMLEMSLVQRTKYWKLSPGELLDNLKAVAAPVSRGECEAVVRVRAKCHCYTGNLRELARVYLRLLVRQGEPIGRAVMAVYQMLEAADGRSAATYKPLADRLEQVITEIIESDQALARRWAEHTAARPRESAARVPA